MMEESRDVPSGTLNGAGVLTAPCDAGRFACLRALVYSKGYREAGLRCLMLACEDLYVRAGLLDVAHIHPFERAQGLKPPPEAGFGLSHPLGHGADLAPAGRQERHDPVGLTQAHGAQNHAGLAVQGHQPMAPKRRL